MATFLQCDLPYFPLIIQQCNPQEIIIIMNDLFYRYDRIIDLHGVRNIFKELLLFYALGQKFLENLF